MNKRIIIIATPVFFLAIAAIFCGIRGMRQTGGTTNLAEKPFSAETFAEICAGWEFGTPYRVEPESPDLPDSGSAMLRTILGWREEIHVGNSACGLVSDRRGPFEYVRSNGTTRILFPEKLIHVTSNNGETWKSFPWEIAIDDATGRILAPEGLPWHPDEEVEELVNAFLAEVDEFKRLCEVLQHVDKIHGGTPRELVEIRINEIHRVSDKINVRLGFVYDSPENDVECNFIDIWIDAWTWEIISKSYIRTGS